MVKRARPPSATPSTVRGENRARDIERSASRPKPAPEGSSDTIEQLVADPLELTLQTSWTVPCSMPRDAARSGNSGAGWRCQVTLLISGGRGGGGGSGIVTGPSMRPGGIVEAIRSSFGVGGTGSVGTGMFTGSGAGTRTCSLGGGAVSGGGGGGGELLGLIGNKTPSDERIFIRSDQTTRYGDFMQVMNSLQDSGFYSVALVGEEQTTK